MQAGTITLKQAKIPVILISLGVALGVVFLFALRIGQVTIPILEMAMILLKKMGFSVQYEINAVHETVLWSIRLPRVLLAVLIGGALSISGAALQGLFRNPLVEPGLIGVSSGAAVSVVTLVVFGSSIALYPDSLSMKFLMPAVAFGGGSIATLLVMRISGREGKTNMAMLILGGVAINTMCGALMGLVIFFANENQLHMFTFWTLGDLSSATWPALLVAAPILVLSSLWLLTYQHALNAIALGEAEAFHMGIDVEKVKRGIVFFCALAVGVSVSLSGIIGFVGLVVPHLIRTTFQADHRLVMPASLLGGPLLLLLADLVSRIAVAPAELPIGVVTALIGAPVFIFLLIHARKRNVIS
ncbi:MAG: iron ABC transporter permease [Cytophaga sp.]|nr:iron ABC transporter permease [Cytophaga sp.]